MESQEYQRVSELYYLIDKKEYKKSKRILDVFSKNYTFHSIRNQKIFDYCRIQYNQDNRLTTKFVAYDMFKTLIDFPKCTNKDFVTFVELITIRRLVMLELDMGRNEALKFLSALLTRAHFDYLSTRDMNILPYIYHSISKVYGIKKEIDLSLSLALEGIKISRRINHDGVIHQLYYIASLGYYKTRQVKSAEDYAKLCLASCMARQDKIMYDFYSNLFLKEQGLTFDFVSSYKKHTSV